MNLDSFLFEKPVKHTAIKSLLSNLSKEKSASIKNNQKTKNSKLNIDDSLSNEEQIIIDSVVSKDSKEISYDTKFHILLAEDNIVNQKVSSVMLEKLGYKVTIANNGKEAFQRTKNHYFDAILMDCQMPIMDGYEATRRIRDLSNSHFNVDIPIIAFTAHAMKDDDNVCKDAGMDDYLSKPVTLEALNNVLKQRHESLLKRHQNYQNKK